MSLIKHKLMTQYSNLIREDNKKSYQSYMRQMRQTKYVPFSENKEKSYQDRFEEYYQQFRDERVRDDKESKDKTPNELDTNNRAKSEVNMSREITKAKPVKVWSNMRRDSKNSKNELSSMNTTTNYQFITPK